MFKVLALSLLWVVGQVVAVRRLTQDVPCGQVLEGTNVLGTPISNAEIPGSTLQPDIEGCISLCENTPGCTGATWSSKLGRCFLKETPADESMTEVRAAFSAFILCDGPPAGPPTPPPPTPPDGLECGQVLEGTNILGTPIPNTEIPGSTLQPDIEGCISLCENTLGCTVATRSSKLGRCFLKDTPVSELVTEDRAAFTGFILCGGGASGPPTETPPPPPPPPPDGVECGQVLEGTNILGTPIPNTDIPGSTLQPDIQGCITLCENTQGCTVATRSSKLGRCFLKDTLVDESTIEARAAFSAFILCDDGQPGPPSNPPGPPPNPPPNQGNPWKTLKPLPVKMGETSSGVLRSQGKDYLIVVGMQAGNDNKKGVTLMYDFEEDVWFEGAKRPFIGDHHNAEVIGNKLYLFGGLGKDVPAQVQIATLSGGSTAQLTIKWTKGANSPVKAGSGATALIDGLVYFCGGIRAKDTISECATYNPDTNKWQTNNIPDMPKGRNHAASCTDGSKLFAFGGRIGGNGSGPGFGDTQIYTPGGSWDTGKPIPLKRGGMGSCVCSGGKCYVFGGEVQSTTAPSISRRINSKKTVYSTDIYNINSDSWSYGTDMPEGLHGIFPVMYKGKAYIAGGGTQAGVSQTTIMYEYTLE